MSILTAPIHATTLLLLVLGTASATAQAGNGPPAPPPPPVPAVGSAVQRDAAVLDRIVSLDLTDVTLGVALHEIAARGDVRLEYSSRMVPVEKRVTVHVTKATVRATLKEVLRGAGVEVVLTSPGSVMLVSPTVAPPDTGIGAVRGRVTDSLTGRPLGRATVTIDDSSGSTGLTVTTSDSGYYGFQRVSAGLRVLRVKRIGYEAAERMVEVFDGRLVQVDVLLRLTPMSLEAVVVTATGSRRRVELGNDI